MTAKQASQKLHKYIKQVIQKSGGSTKYLFLWSPEESKGHGYGECWSVCWEEGPFEWAIYLSGGASMFVGEYVGYNEPPEIDLTNGDGWFCEPYNSFVMGFYDN